VFGLIGCDDELVCDGFRGGFGLLVGSRLSGFGIRFGSGRSCFGDGRGFGRTRTIGGVSVYSRSIFLCLGLLRRTRQCDSLLHGMLWNRVFGEHVAEVTSVRKQGHHINLIGGNALR
jgi:hypothetical protein